MSSFDLPIGVVRRNARERGLVARRGALESAVSSLAIGRHLLLMTRISNEGATVAAILADSAADCGLCFGSLTLSPTAARLLTSWDIVGSQFRDDVWLIARGADEMGLRRIDDYLNVARPNSHWRALVVTELAYADVVRAVSDPARRRFAFLKL
jgi:hypothetical protein